MCFFLICTFLQEKKFRFQNKIHYQKDTISISEKKNRRFVSRKGMYTSISAAHDGNGHCVCYSFAIIKTKVMQKFLH